MILKWLLQKLMILYGYLFIIEQHVKILYTFNIFDMSNLITTQVIIANDSTTNFYVQLLWIEDSVDIDGPQSKWAFYYSQLSQQLRYSPPQYTFLKSFIFSF